MSPVVYHLIGAPGSGKRTVGLELALLTGAVLLDNHLFRDAVYKPYGADGLRPIPAELQELGTRVWALGLQAARMALPDVQQIFTAYHNAQDKGAATAQRIREVAQARQAKYVPVWLECHTDELCRRLTLPERLQRAKMRDPDQLRRTLDTQGLLPPLPGALRIDTAVVSPAEAARLIASNAGVPT
ncbi:hypothetical protein GCM10008955_08050 [Deinococcus malanensis]|uniref:AAA family ATPase n=1 Tax=Deinococcus malanensis TaxID=1706855 RepID=A0ABQ2EN82_9DEIO|nr:hypothetical protein [Deinococcus malanensis]GGK16992.1 hypothetical protein GCM10008955_08050 [Deinococcus malanensis]